MEIRQQWKDMPLRRMELPQMRQSGYACLVEGESDTQSMWYMGISTLGVPGASMFKPNMSDQLQDLKLYIHQEPDQGGETFMRKVIQGLREGGFIGKVYKFSCSTLAESRIRATSSSNSEKRKAQPRSRSS